MTFSLSSTGFLWFSSLYYYIMNHFSCRTEQSLGLLFRYFPYYTKYAREKEGSFQPFLPYSLLSIVLYINTIDVLE